MTSSTSRRTSGSVLADLPAAMWLLLVCLILPILCLMTMSFRAMFFYFAVRDCAYQAAKEQSFTDAKAKAAAAYKKDVGAWNGLAAKGDPTVKVVIRDVTKNTTNEYDGPLKAPNFPVNTQNNLYMVKVYCNGDIQPLIPTGPFARFANIPGLTGPMALQMSYQVYTENPTGLGS